MKAVESHYRIWKHGCAKATKIPSEFLQFPQLTGRPKLMANLQQM